MLFKYKLVFKDEVESLPILAQLPRLKSHAVIIGEYTRYTENPDNPDEPFAERLEGWHVDVVSTTELGFLKPYEVFPKNPIREIPT